MFSFWDIECWTRSRFCSFFVVYDRCLNIQYLINNTFFWAGLSRAFSWPWYLSMGKISGRNSLIWFVHICLAKGRKFGKMVITWEGQRMGTNPFRLLLVSSSSINWYTSYSKLRLTLGDLPVSVGVHWLSWTNFSNISMRQFEQISDDKPVQAI